MDHDDKHIQELRDAIPRGRLFANAAAERESAALDATHRAAVEAINRQIGASQERVRAAKATRTRTDREGRDVTHLPGLWDEGDTTSTLPHCHKNH